MFYLIFDTYYGRPKIDGDIEEIEEYIQDHIDLELFDLEVIKDKILKLLPSQFLEIKDKSCSIGLMIVCLESPNPTETIDLEIG